jgi:hypothetical protein
MSSCLAAMYGTPRVLQSIANENVIPVIQILGRGVSLMQGLKLLSFSACLIFVNSTVLKEFQYRSLTWKEKLYFSNMICAVTSVHYNVSWKYGFVKLLTFLNSLTAEDTMEVLAEGAMIALWKILLHEDPQYFPQMVF